MSDTPQALGLMLAFMHPPPGLEEEFADWYDTEHLPQRAGLPGFLVVSRWVCTEGFPGSLAAYDLASLEALRHPDYLAVSGDRSTPWSKRLLARTARAGRLRVEATQVWPGTATFLPSQSVNRLVVARYRGVPFHALRSAFAVVPRLAQLRLFEAGGETWALAELAGPIASGELFSATGEVGGAGADMMNIYMPYTKVLAR